MAVRAAGLASDEAALRLKRCGPNALGAKKKSTALGLPAPTACAVAQTVFSRTRSLASRLPGVCSTRDWNHFTGEPNMMNMPYNGILGLLILVGDVWAIISIFQSSASNEKKALWIVLVVLLPVVGLILWYFLGPRSGVANRGA